MTRKLTFVFSVLISFSTFMFVSCRSVKNGSAEKNMTQDADTLVLEKDVTHKDSRFASPFKPAHGSHASHCSHCSHASHYSQHS